MAGKLYPPARKVSDFRRLIIRSTKIPTDNHSVDIFIDVYLQKLYSVFVYHLFLTGKLIAFVADDRLYRLVGELVGELGKCTYDCLSIVSLFRSDVRGVVQLDYSCLHSFD